MKRIIIALILLSGVAAQAQKANWYDDYPNRGCWTMTEGVGASVADVSGNGAHSWLTNSPSWGTRGTEGYISCRYADANAMVVSNSVSAAGLSNYAVAVWYYQVSPPANNASIWYEQTATAGYGRFGIYALASSGDLLLSVRDSDAGASTSATWTDSINSNWYHIVACYRTNGIQLWVNGVLVAQNVTTLGAMSAAKTDIIYCGKYGVAAVNYAINGYVSSPIVLVPAPSPSAISNLYYVSSTNYVAPAGATPQCNIGALYQAHQLITRGRP